MPTHRAHDYAALTTRWRSLARRSRLRIERLAHAGAMPLFFLRTRALKSSGGLYLSAGIHGDEAASSEALITWAEENFAVLDSLPLLIFPCLNPWGLVNNSRLDANGHDLNRVFHLNTIPPIAALKQVVAPYQFELALMLHEDFDGQGIYLYEVQRERPYWGEELLKVARDVIPIEGRTRVDGRKAVDGIIRRRFELKRFERLGYPEAVWLHMHHARRAITLETPSEFALEQRVRAQVLVIEESVRRAAGM